MANSQRNVNFHYTSSGIDNVASKLNNLGSTGERTSGRLQKSSAKVSGSLRLIDTASLGAQRGLQNIAQTASVIDGPLGGVASRFTGIAGILRTIGPVGLAAAAGLGGVAVVVGKSISSGSELQKQLFKLNAVIKATGGAAGVSTKQIDTFAKQLGRDTLTSAGAVREASAALLSFKSISGDTFFDTLRLSQDLAATFGGSLKDKTVQLAKALEDPIQGLSALRRSGVSFTQQQKDVIKALVETGEKAEAQRLILKELESQVGGAGQAEAKGLSGSFDTLTENLTELFETISQKTGIVDGLASSFSSVAESVRGLNDAITEDTTQQKIDKNLDRINENIRNELEARRFAQLPNVILKGPDTPAQERVEMFQRENEALRKQNEELTKILEVEKKVAEEEQKLAEKRREAAEEAERAAAAEQKAKEERAKAAEAATKAAEDAAKKRAEEAKRLADLRDQTFQQLRDETTLLQQEIRLRKAGVDNVELQIAASREAVNLEERLVLRTREEQDALSNILGLRLDAQVALKDQIDLEQEKARVQREAQQRLIRAQEAEERRLERLKEKAAEDFQRPFQRAADNIQDSIRDSFRDGLDGSLDETQDFADAFRNIMLDAIAEITAALVFRPVVNSVVNAGSQVLGGVLGGAVSGAQGGSGPLSGLFGGGGGLPISPTSLIPSGFTTAIGQGIGSFLGLGSTASSLGFAAPGAIGAAPAVGAGLGLSTTAASILGGVATAGIGALAGIAIGKIFGGKKSSSGPNAGASLLVNEEGNFFTSGGAADNGGGSLVGPLVEEVNQVVTQLNLIAQILGVTPNLYRDNTPPDVSVRRFPERPERDRSGQELLEGILRDPNVLGDLPDEIVDGILNGTLPLQEEIKSLTEAVEGDITAINASIQAFTKLTDTLDDYLSSLDLSQLSPLSPEARLNEARRQFEATKAGALAGDPQAIEDFTAAANTLLKESKGFFASSSAFVTDFESVRTTARSLRDSIPERIAGEQEALKQFSDVTKSLLDQESQDFSVQKEQLAELSGIRDGQLATIQAIRDFFTARDRIISPEQRAALEARNRTFEQYKRDIGQAPGQVVDVGAGPEPVGGFGFARGAIVNQRIDNASLAELGSEAVIPLDGRKLQIEIAPDRGVGRALLGMPQELLQSNNQVRRLIGGLSQSFNDLMQEVRSMRAELSDIRRNTSLATAR